MAKRRTWTVGKLAKKTGLTRQQVGNLWDENEIPDRVDDGGTWRRVYRTPQVAKWIKEIARKVAERKAKRQGRLARPPRFVRKTYPYGMDFLNDFWEWDHAVKTGRVRLPPTETLRHDFEPVLRKMRKLWPDLFASALRKAPETTPQTEQPSSSVSD